MKFMTVIAVLFAVSSAFASEYVTKKLSWSPMSHSGWTTTYYNCSWAEDAVESHLKDLGAQNVNVSCSGGIEMGWNTPVFITAKYDVAVPAANDVAREVRLSSRAGNGDSCSFNVEFLDRAIPSFPGVKILSKRSSCMGGRTDSWSYNLSITE